MWLITYPDTLIPTRGHVLTTRMIHLQQFTQKYRTMYNTYLFPEPRGEKERKERGKGKKRGGGLRLWVEVGGWGFGGLAILVRHHPSFNCGWDNV